VSTDDGSDTNDDASGFTAQIALFSLSQWRDAIFARIVDKVGRRAYWEDWADDVADISSRQITRITAILAEGDEMIATEFEKFLKGLRDNLNDSITEDDAISMLSQHLITKPVFDALFAGHDFAAYNPVSLVMQDMVDTLGGSGLESETNELEKFYDSVRVRASEVTSAEGKQQVVAELYERFFKIGFAKQAEALGIVYTPVQIVDWILHAADAVSREHFGKGLTDENVHIIDRFVMRNFYVSRDSAEFCSRATTPLGDASSKPTSGNGSSATTRLAQFLLQLDATGRRVLDPTDRSKICLLMKVPGLQCRSAGNTSRGPGRVLLAGDLHRVRRPGWSGIAPFQSSSGPRGQREAGAGRTVSDRATR
jgi:hypothetical protein